MKLVGISLPFVPTAPLNGAVQSAPPKGNTRDEITRRALQRYAKLLIGASDSSPPDGLSG